jgi:hypothetical protein
MHWRAMAFVVAGLVAVGAAQAGGEIHGTVHTTDGRVLTGAIRWDDSESYWDDLLDGSKPGVIREEGEKRSLRILFWKVADLDSNHSSWVRSFSVPFGHLSRIEPLRDESVELTLKDGVVMTVRGWGSDVGPAMGEVVVEDAEQGEEEISWNRIDSIEFGAAVSGSRDAERLYGTVETTAGSFTGYILWDRDEAMFEDILDGEEGHRERDVPFGDIASIERASHRSSRVTLRDGEVVELRGTNDVDRDIRGIDVLVEGIGRVTSSWDTFVRVDFVPAPPSRTYETFDGGRLLRAQVITHDGREFVGQVIWDEDEERTWEALDGQSEGLEYDVMFEHIHSIMPGSEESARVRLKGGELLVLEGHKDVTVENEGIVVRPDGGDEVRLDWADVRLVTFLDS